LKSAPEYGGRDVPGLTVLFRLRYGAKLHRETGLPMLVTGGAPEGSEESEAAIMARVLREDFAVPVKWLEHQSNNTAQNAQMAAPILKQAGIYRILLVTDAIHMPRSRMMFAHNGLQVVPAPTTFFSSAPISPDDFVPNGSAFGVSHYALHEWIGIWWYRIRHGATMPGKPE
jgi:uncharacterized SAM-binding protein YcdF (DUF218 family)